MKRLVWILLVASCCAQQRFETALNSGLNSNFALDQRALLPLPDPLPPPGDTPSSVQPPAVKMCGPWKCWDYHAQHLSTRQVLKSGKFWGMVGGGFLGQAFDNEMTKAGLGRTYRDANGVKQHKCVEKYVNPPFPSRGDLYLNNWKEELATTVVAFVWVKLKGPSWVEPMMIAAPVTLHTKAGLSWTQGRCW